jgi:TetR/AcrR family transcriptional regulator, transcriptional repressor for nem operon
MTIQLVGMTARPNPARRERILQEAEQLFFARGLKGVSMDEVAAAADVKKANLFHYYPSKEALEVAVLDRFSASLRERVAEQFAAEGLDPIAAVALMFEEAAKGMRRRRCRGGCFAGNLAQEASDHRESVRTRVATLLRFWVAAVADLLERGRASGFFRRELKAVRSAEAILSLFEGALLFSKASRQPAAIDSAREMAVSYLQAFRTVPRTKNAKKKSSGRRSSGAVLAYRT